MKNIKKTGAGNVTSPRKISTWVLFFVSFILLLLIFQVSCKKSSDKTIGTVVLESNELATDAEGRQIIGITASGGYYPEEVYAKSGIDTVLRIESDNAYGCERSFRIPGMGVSETLPINGFTDIDIGIQQKGTSLLGTCSMGMYTFEIFFN